MTEPDYIAAYKYSISHRKDVEASEFCGCFYCLEIFRPLEINEWTDGKSTALCPYCKIDSVIGLKSGYPITVEFLQKMQTYWFTTK